MTNIYNSEKSTKSSTKQCSSEIIIIQNVLWNAFFYANLSQGNILYWPKFYRLKILILPALVLKWNKTCYIQSFLSRFSLVSQVISANLDEFCLFLSHLRSDFFNDGKWAEKTILVLPSRRIINWVNIEIIKYTCKFITS